jgi:hypothetical protein
VTDQLEDRASGVDFHDRWRVRYSEILQVRAEPVESETMVVGDAGDESGRWLRPVLSGAASFDAGRALGHKPLQRTIGVGSRQPGGSGNGIASPRTAGQEDLIDQALGRGESEMGEVEASHW